VACTTKLSQDLRAAQFPKLLTGRGRGSFGPLRLSNCVDFPCFRIAIDYTLPPLNRTLRLPPRQDVISIRAPDVTGQDRRKPSRTTIGSVLESFWSRSQLPVSPLCSLEKWRRRGSWQRGSDGTVLLCQKADGGQLMLIDVRHPARREAGFGRQGRSWTISKTQTAACVAVNRGAEALCNLQLSNRIRKRRLTGRWTRLETWTPNASHLSILRACR